MTIPLGSLLHFRTLENIPILVLVVIGVLAFRCLNTDDKPASAEGSLAVAVLVGFPRFIRKGTDQGGEEDQPLVVERVESVKAIAHLADGAELL